MVPASCAMVYGRYGGAFGNAMVTDRLDVLCPFTLNYNKFLCIFNDTGNETEVEASVASKRNRYFIGFLAALVTLR
jgi:hypothetical protein